MRDSEIQRLLVGENVKARAEKRETGWVITGVVE